MSPSPLHDLDTSAIGRALSQVAERPGDLADCLFERIEVVELPPDDASPGLRVRREQGLAVRLLRAGRSWLAARDRLERDAFHDALRRVARAMPRAPYPLPRLAPPRWSEPVDAAEVLEFPTRVHEARRRRRGAADDDGEGTKTASRGAANESMPKLTVRRHRRWLRVVGSEVSSSVESESFYSIDVRMGGIRRGLLAPTLDDATADDVASILARGRRAEGAEPPEGGKAVCVLGAAAAAVLLHEAVAHALEADLLARGGHPEAAIGVELGSKLLDLFDDPRQAPSPVARTADDEGFPTLRRCLLRRGVVEQPIADAGWSRRADLLVAGSGRRGSRHDPPGPRSHHLELVAGESSFQDLLAGAEGGIYCPEAERGSLDAHSGRFTLVLPWGLRIHNHSAGPPVGRTVLRGRIHDLLHAVTGVGREVKAAGAGWCAKDGVLLPVWATTPEIRLEGIEIGP